MRLRTTASPFRSKPRLLISNILCLPVTAAPSHINIKDDLSAELPTETATVLNTTVKTEAKMEVDETPNSALDSPQMPVSEALPDQHNSIINETKVKLQEEPQLSVKAEVMDVDTLIEPSLPLAAASAPSSLEIIDLRSSPIQDSGSFPLMDDSSPEEDEASEEPKSRPVTRQMARSSGEEVWPWSNALPGMTELYDDDTFVVDGVEMAEKSSKRMFDGLEPPRSLNYLDPTREEAKKARKSALEQLKQSRATRVQRTAENIVTNEEAPQLPIFDAPEEEEPMRPPRAGHPRPSSNNSTPRRQDRTEALEVRKRKRDFETPIGDYLPSYGPDFIVDDGSGYSVDPLYRTPRAEGHIATNNGTTLTSSGSSRINRASTSSPAARSTSSRSTDISVLDRVDDYDDEQSRRTPSSTFFTPTRTITATSSSTASTTAGLDESLMRSDDLATSTVLSERSNPASLGGMTTSTRTAGPYAGTDASIAPKLRLTVLIREERFFISCPEESTFSWLQSTASSKYRSVSRMEVDLDHLETSFGARLMPEDKVREYMNDLETVVAIIKESRPLDLLALYKADCAMLALPENTIIVERFSAMNRSETLAGGAHALLALKGAGLESSTLPSLYGVLNLHSFVNIDLSSNQLTPPTVITIFQEMSKSNGLESPANFRSISLADNLLGLSFDVDSAFRSLLGRFTSLTSLNLSENCLNDRAIAALVPPLLQQAVGLTSLDLSSNLFGLDAIKAIDKGYSKFGSLTRLNLARNPLREEGFSFLIKTLGDNATLHTLDLSYCNVFTKAKPNQSNAPSEGPTSMEATIEALGSKLSALSHLYLRGCKIDTWSHPMLLPTLCMSLKRIHVLDLADCDLVAQDLRFLKSLVLSPALGALNLSFNNLSSDRKIALEFCLSAPKHQKLTLTLQECNLYSEKQEMVNSKTLLPNLTVDLIGN